MNQLRIENILKVVPVVIAHNPKFLNLSFVNYENIISKKFIMKFNPKLTWGEMGFDDLDLVEMIMELEKQFNFDFPDILFDGLFGMDQYPIDFRVVNRNNKIDKLID